ncbi:MAG: methionine--tRNA ligase subunit beta [Chloroflexi bacterium]|nr:methionine--tRNA ligase subunit beta [Chloroflexota bacterium]
MRAGRAGTLHPFWVQGSSSTRTHSGGCWILDPGFAIMAPVVSDDWPLAAEEAEVLSIDEFRKLELRVGLVKVAERVPGATRLLRLEVDLGDEARQIVAGIAQWYQPEDLVGKRIVVVANLEPATIRGLQSQGMLLAAGGRAPGTDLAVLTLDREIPPGTRVE